MRKKIFKTYFFLIAAFISIGTLFSLEVTSNVYQREVENKLLSIASFIQISTKSALQDSSDVNYNKVAKDLAFYHNKTFSVSQNQHIRITFLDITGRVLGDSEFDWQQMENHLHRKEIQEAIGGNVGIDIRESSTLKEGFLYVAVPMSNHKIIVRVSLALKELIPIQIKILGFGFLSILILGLLAAILSYKLSGVLTRPFHQVVMAANAISEGNYAYRIRSLEGDEIVTIANAFNRLAKELERYISALHDKNIEVQSIINSITNGIVAVDSEHRIIHMNPVALNLFQIGDSSEVIGKKLVDYFRNNRINMLLSETIKNNVCLEEDIPYNGEKILHIHLSPMKETDKELQNNGGILFIQDITRLKKLEQMRTEFVSNVTHELKTPLTSIRGFIETLRNGSAKDPKRLFRYLDIIDIEAERLYLLISDILNLSEIETKLTDIDMGPVKLKQVVEEVLEICQPFANEKQVSFYNNMDENLLINANKNRMKQLFLNLVTNAIKYNKAGGEVHVYGNQKQGRVVLGVKDTGIGIDEKHISRIFERFYRVDKSRSREMGGTGLGLSIVKHIVHLYNGDIKLISKPDEGSEFIIQIPQSYIKD